jgi:hypothetical protein
MTYDLRLKRFFELPSWEGSGVGSLPHIPHSALQ